MKVVPIAADGAPLSIIYRDRGREVRGQLTAIELQERAINISVLGDDEGGYHITFTPYAEIYDLQTGEAADTAVGWIVKRWIDAVFHLYSTVPLPLAIRALVSPNLYEGADASIAQQFQTLDKFIRTVHKAQDEIEAYGVRLGSADTLEVVRQLNEFELPDVAPNVYALLLCHGVGHVTVYRLISWVSTEYFNEILTYIRAKIGSSVDTAATPIARRDEMTVVFAGTLAMLTRAEAKDRVERAGAKVRGSVGSDTTHLVVGLEPSGNKLSLARRLGVKQLSEAEFLSLFP